MEKIITTKDVHLYYGSKEALKVITLDFPDKGIHALIGPSGCGKSTYLRTLNRMNDMIENVKIEGEFKFKNQDIYDEKIDLVELRKKIGMVFQQPNPFPMSIYDNIAYGPRCQGLKNRATLDEIVVTSLKEAALYDEVKDRLKKSALSLSGGQQQRLCIARCLALGPDCILMDEPTSALDPIATSKVEELIAELKENYTIIIVTHNMQQATRVSDYTAFFMLGDLIEFNKTEEFFSHPKEKKSYDYITGRFS